MIHLIECHCTLKIYEKRKNIQEHLYHKFTVYSKLDSSGKIIEKVVLPALEDIRNERIKQTGLSGTELSITPANFNAFIAHGKSP